MAKDPVCGMEVDEINAGFTTHFEHETFYFCSKSCRESFELDKGIRHDESGKKWWQKIIKEPKKAPPKCH